MPALLTPNQLVTLEERNFLKEIFNKKKRNEDDFSETLALINKYKALWSRLDLPSFFCNQLVIEFFWTYQIIYN